MPDLVWPAAPGRERPANLVSKRYDLQPVGHRTARHQAQHEQDQEDGNRDEEQDRANGDRGPRIKTRVIDVSLAAARALGMQQKGVTRVRLEAFQADQSGG